MQPPDENRSHISRELSETFAEDLPGLSWDDPELLVELERRSADLKGSIPWEQLRDELRAQPRPNPGADTPGSPDR